MPDPLSLTGARWSVAQVSAERVADMAQRFDVPLALAGCLARRYQAGQEPGEGWLNPTLDHLHDPTLMHGMGRAIARLQRARDRAERVRIITDYDVDGTTSSLILQAALGLAAPKITVDYHIPDRWKEGYGFSTLAADAAADAGVDLIVTADIGIRDHAAVQRAKERGVDVLICDHHLPPGESVPADAIVLCPPQQACSYPNPHLAACGVSLKLAQALLVDHPKRDAIVQSLLKLAAIGTVADLVPLTTLENRAIVTLGLRQLNEGRHNAGLSALLEVSGAERGHIDEGKLGYQVGPRINAAGRIDDASLVIRLLHTRDPATARELAKQLDALNTERKKVQAHLIHEVLGQVGDASDPFIVAAGNELDGWHRGVVGIVAARVKDELHRPVAVLSIQGDRAVGSVRSTPGVHAVRALESVHDLLERFGGHPAAAGFTVPTEHIDALRDRLGAYVTEHAAQADPVPQRTHDGALAPKDLGMELYEAVRRVAPFGMGNPRPTFLLSGLRPERIDVRAGGRLLKFEVRGAGGQPVEAVWWGQGEQAPVLRGATVDVLAQLELNVWRGRAKLQLAVQDLRLA